MPLYHFSAKLVKRSEGRSVVAAAAYRSGSRIADKRQGVNWDYSHKRGVVHTEIRAPISAPEWMKSRDKLWNGVEFAELRRDAQLARDFTLALPVELSLAEKIRLIREFVDREMVELGMIVDLAIHRPDSQSDERNWHAHLLGTLRELDQGGFGKKVREWNQRSLLEGWREKWANYTNLALKAAGVEGRVDHRTLQKQKEGAIVEGDLNAAVLLDREPTHHLGVHATAMERRNIDTDKGDINRKICARNAQRAQILSDLKKLYDLAIDAIRTAGSQLKQAWQRLETAFGSLPKYDDIGASRNAHQLGAKFQNSQNKPKRKTNTRLDRARKRVKNLVENRSISRRRGELPKASDFSDDGTTTQFPDLENPDVKGPKL